MNRIPEVQPSFKSVCRSEAGFLLPLLVILLLLILGVFLFSVLDASSPGSGPKRPPAEHYLAAEPESAAQPQGFRLEDVPPWLFAHVALIAGLQVSALIGAHFASQGPMSRSRAATVLFLVEVPMYLGLFGTLLGVSLTQFITGSLVAPLAYLTTMSGIALHVLGKLAIWLPMTAAAERED